MSSPANTFSYIGSKISLISNCEIRYEGVLYSINTEESTVALSHVRTFGTEGRKNGINEIPPSDEVYDFIVFRGKDIKDLTVCQAAKSVPDDPAIVAVNSAPPAQQVAPVAHGNQMGGVGDLGLGGPGASHYAGAMGPRPDRQQYDRYGGGMGPRMPGANRNNMMYPGTGSPTMGRGGADYRKPERNNYGGAFMPRRGYNYVGYGRGRTNGGMNIGGARRIVGELPAQPNQAVKSQVSEAFDFEGANAKFDKSTLKPQVQAAAANGDAAAGASAAAGSSTTGTSTVASPSTDASGKAVAAGEKKEAVIPMVRPGYDKNQSFFDNISCETLDRQSGQDTRVDRDKQRALDSETFGAAAAAALNRGSRFRRGYRRTGTGNFRQGRSRFGAPGYGAAAAYGGYAGYGSGYGGPSMMAPQPYGYPRVPQYNARPF